LARVDDDVVYGEEHAEEEEEGAEGDKDEGGFFQGDDEFGEGERASVRGRAGADCEVGDDLVAALC